MENFMIQFTYTTGSWARMLKVTDDRAAAVRKMLESVGGSLERMWWDAERCTAYAIADLPDAVTAAAVITATTRTGAFTKVEAHEMLNQDQLQDALALAKVATAVFHPPGDSAIED
jgi:uncharacterized protein with GYD domain